MKKIIINKISEYFRIMTNYSPSIDPIIFTKYNDLVEHIINEIGYKPSNFAGINYNKDMKTTVLISVDNIKYYKDDLSDINKPKYTLFGHNGDQKENGKYNKSLLNDTEHIYLYRVIPINTTSTNYLWYGKYEIEEINKINNYLGRNMVLRTIIVLTLKRL